MWVKKKFVRKTNGFLCTKKNKCNTVKHSRCTVAKVNNNTCVWFASVFSNMADASHVKLLQCTWINLQIPLLGTSTVWVSRVTWGTSTVWVSRVMWGWWPQHLIGKMGVLALSWSPLEQLLSVWCQWTSYFLILLDRSDNMPFMDLTVKDRRAQVICSLGKQSLCTVWKDGEPKVFPFLSLSTPRVFQLCQNPYRCSSEQIKLTSVMWA